MLAGVVAVEEEVGTWTREVVGAWMVVVVMLLEAQLDVVVWDCAQQRIANEMI